MLKACSCCKKIMNKLWLFRAMRNFRTNCESCLHEWALFSEISYGEKPHQDAAQRNRDGALNRDLFLSYRSSSLKVEIPRKFREQRLIPPMRTETSCRWAGRTWRYQRRRFWIPEVISSIRPGMMLAGAVLLFINGPKKCVNLKKVW